MIVMGSHTELHVAYLSVGLDLVCWEQLHKFHLTNGCDVVNNYVE